MHPLWQFDSSRPVGLASCLEGLKQAPSQEESEKYLLVLTGVTRRKEQPC